MESETDLRSYRRYCYIVEGMMDEDKLKKLGCLFVIKTGGKYIRPEIIRFIKNVSEHRFLVLVTDPDGPGRQIRERIQREVGECFVAEAKKEDAIKKGKVGIAEMKMEDLKTLLKPYVHHDLFVDENLSLEDEDFLDLGLTGPEGKQKRMKLIKRYSIPYTSKKNVLDAMLMLGKTKQDLEEELEDE